MSCPGLADMRGTEGQCKGLHILLQNSQNGHQLNPAHSLSSHFTTTASSTVTKPFPDSPILDGLQYLVSALSVNNVCRHDYGRNDNWLIQILAVCGLDFLFSCFFQFRSLVELSLMWTFPQKLYWFIRRLFLSSQQYAVQLQRKQAQLLNGLSIIFHGMGICLYI